MKILLKYLKPHKWLVGLTLLLAGINIGFSLIDPILLGKLVNLASDRQTIAGGYTSQQFFWANETIIRNGKSYWQLGVAYLVIFPFP